jgi:queuine tRNA-ribosyltransferase
VTAPRFEAGPASASGARLGRLLTTHGTVETPAFMPVGTHGSVKGITPAQLRECGASMILCNAYHLAQRPGVEVVAELGGIHALTGWDGPILTDSGGYQVMSLAGLVKIDDVAVRYRSHVDGSKGTMGPEDAVRIQEALGVDVAMSLDECVKADASEGRVREAVERTTRWAARGLAVRTREATALFGIVQGGIDTRWRAESVAGLLPLGFDGYAVGGLSVGEPSEETARIAAETVRLLPDGRPRYLMGMGTPADLIRFAGMGYDLFDCVLPTRNGRNGMLFTREGKLMIRNARHARDPRPADESCGCYTCRHFSRGALRHLALAKEMLGAQLASLHNLHFYQRLMAAIRSDLRNGTFPAGARAVAGAWA